MTENDDHTVTSLDAWRAKHQPDQPNYERWPIPQPYGQWLTNTDPGPQEPCPECGCWSLRRATPPDNPAADKRVVCVMIRCVTSPFYRDDRA